MSPDNPMQGFAAKIKRKNSDKLSAAVQSIVEIIKENEEFKAEFGKPMFNTATKKKLQTIFDKLVIVKREFR